MDVSGSTGVTPTSSYTAWPTTGTSGTSGVDTSSSYVLPDTYTSGSSSSASTASSTEEKEMLALLEDIMSLLEQLLKQELSTDADSDTDDDTDDDTDSDSDTDPYASDYTTPTSGTGSTSSTGSTSATGSSSSAVPSNLQQIDSEYGTEIDNALAANGNPSGLTKQFVEAEIMQESSGNSQAVGDNGTSLGLLQINNDDAAYTSGKYAGGNRLDSQTNIDMAVEDMTTYADQGDTQEQISSAYETGGNTSGIGDGYAASVQSILNGGD